MDIVERRLQQLEADYEATVCAGQAKKTEEPKRSDEPCIETPDLSLCCEEMLPKIEPVKFEPRLETPPLTREQVDGIKKHMQSIKLAHEPEWASTLSDDQFRKIFKNVFGRDDNSYFFN